MHGDDWRNGIQKGIRKEVNKYIKRVWGELREFPYSYDKKYIATERKLTAELAMPDMRRSRLRKLLNLKRMVTALEAHSGLTGLIVEKQWLKMKVEFVSLMLYGLVHCAIRQQKENQILNWLI